MEYLDNEYIEDCFRYPAATNCSYVYFIKDNKILCIGQVGSRREHEITIYLYDNDGLEIFKNDFAVKTLGKNAPFRFLQHDGSPSMTFDDRQPDRLEGISIVSKFDFDYGYASKKRYGHIPGFGAEMVIRKLSI